MNSPRKRWIVASVAALVVALGAVLFWLHARSSIPADEVAAFLDATVGAGRVRFTVTAMEPVRQDGAGRQVAVTAKAWLVQPLYRKVDTSDYLQREFQVEPESAAEARALLLDKATARNTVLTGGRPLPADPFLVVVLEPTSPTDVSFDFQGILDAHRAGSAWGFSLASGGIRGGGPQGEPRSAFERPSYVAGDAGDAATVRSLVSDFRAFAARAAKVRHAAEIARTAAHDARRASFLARIAPGRVFSGRASEAGEQNGTPLYLEITGLTPDNRMTAVLRNEGGWHNARAFQGSWSSDEDFLSPALTLTSPAALAVRNAGPVLENTQNWTLELKMDPSGELTGQTRYFQYRFQPLLPIQVTELKARLEAEFERALAATQAGTVYQGSVSPGALAASEPVVLQVTGRLADGRSFEASLESTAHPWSRPLHGTIIDNARRSGGEPLRLRTSAREAVEDAPPASMLGDPEDLELSLGLSGGSLAGGDGRYTYQLAPAGNADLGRLEAARADRARLIREIVRPGMALDGTLREDQGFITHARLEVVGLDRASGAVTVTVRSLARPGVFRDFAGTCDPPSGLMALSAAARGRYGDDGSFDIPFLTSPAASSLHLELAGKSLAGRIEGDPHWALEFPAAAFLSAPTELDEPGSPPADGSVFPAFPKAAGAYLLGKAGWLPMPRNQGHVVAETITLKTEKKAPPTLLGAVNAGLDEALKSKDKAKVTYLEFDGKDVPPVSSGQSVVVLYVGPEPSGEPAVELAPTEVQSDGQRWLEITERQDKGIRFGERRMAAFVRRPAPGYILLTTTGTLAPGSYAFRADQGYELTQE